MSRGWPHLRGGSGGEGRTQSDLGRRCGMDIAPHAGQLWVGPEIISEDQHP